MSTSSNTAALYQEIAFAPWGSTFRPIVVLNPYTDVPEYIRKQWAALPSSQEFQICCWIGGDIAFLPLRNIIDYNLGVAGYDEELTLAARKSTLCRRRPVERGTRMAMDMMKTMIDDSPEKRVQTVTRRLSFYDTVY